MFELNRVFDAVRKPLESPYHGPFQVLKKSSKYFLLDLHGCKDTVSIGRLKPAYFDTDCATGRHHHYTG